MKGWNGVVCVLVIVGAINWGLVGLGMFMGQNWNVVNLVLGSWPTLEWIIYVLIGIAGIVHIKGCRSGGSMMM